MLNRTFYAVKAERAVSRVIAALLIGGLPLWWGCSSDESGISPPTASISADPSRETADSTPAAADPRAAAARHSAPQTDNLKPIVLIETSLGNIRVELDRRSAPVTVNNFLNYVDSGHYDGTLFHQVIEGFIVLGGGFDREFVRKPTSFPIRNEADNGLSNTRGTIAMARQPDVIASSDCQFFFNVSDNPSLDYKSDDPEGYGYCVFGKVIEGMDVVERISRVPVADRDGFTAVPVEQVEIRSVRRDG